MPTLVLVRHAEAANAPLDKDRPLTERGTRDAAAIGGWLADAGVVPDVVVVSPARRAAQTWQRAAAALPSVPEPVVDQRIYDNTVDDLVEVIRETSDDVRTLVVVGHNPGIGALACELDDGRGSEPARQQLARGFPAGGAALLDLATSFAGAAPGTAAVRDVWVPPRGGPASHDHRA